MMRVAHLRHCWALAGLLGLGSPACSSLLDPVDGCEMFLDALSTRAMACGFDYDETYATFERDIGGSCSSIVDLRDAHEFEDECIPWAQNMTCEQLTDPASQLDPSCEGQLIRGS